MSKNDKANLLDKEFNEWGLNEGSPPRGTAAKEDNSLPGIAQELTEVNRQLLAHIAELERDPVQTAETPAIPNAPVTRELDWQYTDAHTQESQQESHLSSVIKSFEEEIDGAITLENGLQADLQEVLDNTSRESAAKADLETRAGLLETQASLVDDLRKQIHPTEEDRDRISKALAETESELKSVTGECNAFNEKLSAVQEENRWLQSKRSDLQARESALDKRISDMDEMRQELNRSRTERDLLDGKVCEFERRLETTNKSVEELRPDLEASRKLAHSLRAKVEEDRTQIAGMRRQHDAVNADLSNVRAQIDSRTTANRQLEAQVKTLTKNCEVVDTELDSAREALGRFHRAAIKFHQRTRDVLSRRRSRVQNRQVS